MEKPFHLMTPAERTALRIAQNKAISEKIAEKNLAEGRSTRTDAPKTTRKRNSSSDNGGERVPAQPPPARSTSEFTRATPEERAQLGKLIRKVQS